MRVYEYVDIRLPVFERGPLNCECMTVERETGSSTRPSPGTGIGSRLYQLRTARSLTQRELAEPRYTAAFVSTVESGGRTPSAEAVRYFAKRLGVAYDELATGRPADASVRLGLSLAEALRVLSAGDHEQATRLCLDVEAEADRLDLRDVWTQARLTRARSATRAGDLERAKRLYGETERLLSGEPLPSRVPAIAGRARCLFLSGEPRYAAHVLENALSQLRGSGLTDPAAMLTLQSGLATVYFGLRSIPQAAAAADEALALAPRVADPERVASMHVAVAQVFMTQRRIADAETSLGQAYDLFHQLDMRAETGWCHWVRGYMLVRERHLDDAAGELTKASEILEEAGNARDVAGVFTELAEVERLRERPWAAREILQEAGERIAGSADTLVVAEIARGLGRVAWTEGCPAQAETDVRRAAELFEQAGAPEEIAFTLRLLGDLLRERGRLDDAARVYREGLAAVIGTSS